ncbi:MAG: hypothetical protein ACXVDA_05765, partial [Ktedonobacterales bacterium]
MALPFLPFLPIFLPELLPVISCPLRGGCVWLSLLPFFAADLYDCRAGRTIGLARMIRHAALPFLPNALPIFLPELLPEFLPELLPEFLPLTVRVRRAPIEHAVLFAGAARWTSDVSGYPFRCAYEKEHGILAPMQ